MIDKTRQHHDEELIQEIIQEMIQEMSGDKIKELNRPKKINWSFDQEKI